MEATVESLCNALAHSRLLTPEAVRTLYQRWCRDAKEAAPDVNRFSHWLVDSQIVSEYQLGVLSRGRGDQLFLNQYKIIERIGKGRMAGVYKAVHNLGQSVAIKVLPPSKARDTAVFARFQREARLAVRLEHPNIVRTFQMDDAGGLHYLVMEYLEGQTLAEALSRRGKLTVPEAVHVIFQALQGLQHLHEQGLVHRDLSPENLMLLGGDPDDLLKATVKILDIGTGRELFDEEGQGDGEFALTARGDILGTPSYMSPEQAADPHGADIRADLYSLGCVFFHMLTGQPPFVDKSNVRLLVRHAKEAPPLLSELRPDAPAGLQRILDRLLAKDRSKRFTTPEDTCKALQPFVAEPVSADSGPLRPEYRAYLEWLKTQKSESEPESKATKSAVAQPGIVPSDVLEDLAKSEAGVPAPRGLREAAEARKRAKKAPAEPPRQPKPSAPPPESPEPPREPARRSPPLPKKARIAAAVKEPEPAETLMEVVPVDGVDEVSGEDRSAGISGRDLMMVGIGVGVVCILLLGAVVVILLLR
jgi:serine/threonine protein kinase